MAAGLACTQPLTTVFGARPRFEIVKSHINQMVFLTRCSKPRLRKMVSRVHNC
jgi:hypothetical protein